MGFNLGFKGLIRQVSLSMQLLVCSDVRLKKYFYHYCLSGCESWSLLLEEQTLLVLVSRVLTRMCLVSKAGK